MIDDERNPAWRRYLRLVRPNAAGDVDDELAFHFQSAIDEFIAAGMTPADARDAARKKFGDVDRITQTLYTLSEQRERHMQRTEWLDTIKQDVVFALRQLRKSPAFTAVAVLTLALGIGANTAIFSVVYSVLLRPLPFANANRVVMVSQLGGQDTLCCAPFGNWNAWRTQSRDFVALGATWGARPLTLTGHGEPTSVTTVLASSDYWRAMFIPPVLGRYYRDDEDRESNSAVVVLSEAMWHAQFNGDSSVIGKTIVLNAQPRQVIGIAPQEYVLTPPAERVWIPLAPAAWRFNDFGDHELRVYGLLKPGVSAASAALHLRRIEEPIAKENPHHGYDGRVAATPLADWLIGDQRTNLYTLLGAVTLVLLIACVNIANLLLARAAVRRGEIAIRGALGASRQRIVAQLLVEAILLALAGAIVGLVIAYAGMRFLVSSPAAIPRLQSTTINLPVLAFTLALAVGCAIIFGLVPALRAARTDLQQTLRDGGRESRGAARERLRGVLVVSELCIAQVLLIGAGLLIRSAMIVQSVPAGFDTKNVLAMGIQLPPARFKSNTDYLNAFEQIQTAIRAIPGVKSVAYAQVAPIYGGGWNWTAFREGSNGHDEGATGADMRSVSADYFTTLGIHLARGRDFTAADNADGQPVVIISRGLATHLFGNEDPIGRRVSNGSVDKPNWREVVGVADDIHGNGLQSDPYPAFYMPAPQSPNPTETFMVRGNVPVTTLVPEIRRAVASVDPLLPLSNVSTMEASIADLLALPRFDMWLLSLLGATGLILAVVGVYGVIGYFVTQRRHELGVRIALGASGGSVQWLVVKQGLLFAGIGMALGLPIAFVATRLLRSLMFGITAHDPLTFVVVALILGAVALTASYIPARRATRIDPLEALRSS